MQVTNAQLPEKWVQHNNVFVKKAVPVEFSVPIYVSDSTQHQCINIAPKILWMCQAPSPISTPRFKVNSSKWIQYPSAQCATQSKIPPFVPHIYLQHGMQVSFSRFQLTYSSSMLGDQHFLIDFLLVSCVLLQQLWLVDSVLTMSSHTSCQMAFVAVWIFITIERESCEDRIPEFQGRYVQESRRKG